MIPTKYNLGVRGVRSGGWSQSKWTNSNKFDPGGTEINNVISKFYNRIYRNPNLTIIVLPTHPAFLIPLDEISIRKTLEAVPKKFTISLAAVIVLSGSKKQEKTFRSFFAYGRYAANVIFIHPFPKKYMDLKYKALPKPSVLSDYERAGAKVTPEGKQWCIQFDEESLKQFYLRDVLLHELGHHVDAENFRFKSGKKAEGFAEWFASEYGYRLRLRKEA